MKHFKGVWGRKPHTGLWIPLNSCILEYYDPVHFMSLPTDTVEHPEDIMCVVPTKYIEIVADTKNPFDFC